MPAPRYGSVPQSEPATDTEGQLQQEQQSPHVFREDSMLYVKPRVLSPREKWKKCMLASIPLIAALIMVGGAAYLLLRKFDIFYPPPDGDYSPQYTPRYAPYHSSLVDDTVPTPVAVSHKAPPPSPVSAPEPTSTSSSSSKSSSNGSANCSAHPKCDELGLIGVCCPTQDGVLLGCC
jgi:hypothetical protein